MRWWFPLEMCTFSCSGKINRDKILSGGVSRPLARLTVSNKDLSNLLNAANSNMSGFLSERNQIKKYNAKRFFLFSCYCLLIQTWSNSFIFQTRGTKLCKNINDPGVLNKWVRRIQLSLNCAYTCVPTLGPIHTCADLWNRDAWVILIFRIRA
jgi:hypothetical protein